MRVAIVTKSLVPSGNPSWVGGLASGLRKLGHEPTIVYIRDSKSLRLFTSEFRNVPLEFTLRGRMARISEMFGWPLSIFLLNGGYGVEGAPDPISWASAPFLGNWHDRFDLCIMYDQFTGLGGLLCELVAGLPYVLFLHEGSTGTPKSLGAKFQLAWRNAIASRAELVCALDQPIADALVAGGIARVEVIPSGCDPIDAIVLPKDPFVLLDCRWTPPRNPFFVLDIAELTPGVSYTMLGSFWTEELREQFLSELRRRDLSQRISVRTGLPSDVTAEYYTRAMVYIRWAAHGSGGWERGYPMGIRTALSCGCPVLFDYELGCRDVIGLDMPFSLMAHDPRDYARKILDMSQNPDLVRMLAEQSLMVARKHTWEDSAKRLISALSPPITP